MKYMRVKFKNGETWQFPAFLVARDRADYYAERDSGGDRNKYGGLYKEEFDYTMSQDAELTDWFANEMSWSDVKERAVLVPKSSKPFDYEAALGEAELKIAEVEGTEASG